MLLEDTIESKSLKLAIFDFCDTLVSFQTADAFVDYVRINYNTLNSRILNALLIISKNTGIIKVLNYLFPGSSIEKRIKLFQLKGIKSDKLDKLAEQFYCEKIRPNLIPGVISEMQELKKEGSLVCVASAAYSVYLKYFAEEYNVNHIISTNISFNHSNGLCKGIFEGRDCVRDEKVNRIKSHFIQQDIDYYASITYSDSLSDLPILLLTGRGVVISHNNPQQWNLKYKFKEIIWD